MNAAKTKTSPNWAKLICQRRPFSVLADEGLFFGEKKIIANIKTAPTAELKRISLQVRAKPKPKLRIISNPNPKTKPIIAAAVAQAMISILRDSWRAEKEAFFRIS